MSNFLDSIAQSARTAVNRNDFSKLRNACDEASASLISLGTSVQNEGEMTELLTVCSQISEDPELVSIS